MDYRPAIILLILALSGCLTRGIPGSRDKAARDDERPDSDGYGVLPSLTPVEAEPSNNQRATIPFDLGPGEGALAGIALRLDRLQSEFYLFAVIRSAGAAYAEISYVRKNAKIETLARQKVFQDKGRLHAVAIGNRLSLGFSGVNLNVKNTRISRPGSVATMQRDGSIGKPEVSTVTDPPPADSQETVPSTTTTPSLKKDDNASQFALPGFRIKAPFPNTAYFVGAGEFRYIPGDFNGDGRADLVHLADPTYAHVWLSKGDGTFDIGPSFPANGYALNTNDFHFLPGDFDGNGRTDLIHFVNNNYVHVWLSNGDGTFTITSPFPNSGYAVSSNNYNFKIGDFNGDGKSDLVHFVNNNYLHLWLSNGDGTFAITSPFPNSGYAVSSNNYNYKIGDFNGDGRSDLIHFVNNNYIHLWLSNGDGTFSITSPFPNSDYAVSSNDYNFKSGDFNGDGKTDLIHFVNNNYVHLWLSNGDGTFAITSPFPNSGYAVSLNNYDYLVGDVDGDGSSDLVHFVNTEYVHAWLSQGDGTFTIEDPFLPGGLYDVGANNYRYIMQDHDGDGRSDLVHLASPYHVHVWLRGMK